MIMDHPNAELARRGYDAFQRGDAAAVAGFFAEDAVFHVTGNTRLSGTTNGRPAIQAMLQAIVDATGNSLRMEVIDLFASDTLTVSVLHETATRADDGRQLDGRTVLVHRLDEDRKVVECWELVVDADAYDRFFG